MHAFFFPFSRMSSGLLFWGPRKVYFVGRAEAAGSPPACAVGCQTHVACRFSFAVSTFCDHGAERERPDCIRTRLAFFFPFSRMSSGLLYVHSVRIVSGHGLPCRCPRRYDIFIFLSPSKYCNWRPKLQQKTHLCKFICKLVRFLQ